MNSTNTLKTMILAVAALLCLTLFQNCSQSPDEGLIRTTSRLQGHVVVATSIKSAQHSIK